MLVDKLPAIHPGEILREEYLSPLGLSSNALARELHVPPTRIARLVRCEAALTPDTALRLARFFGTTPQFWLNMQASFDLKTSAKRIERELGIIHQYRIAV